MDKVKNISANNNILLGDAIFKASEDIIVVKNLKLQYIAYNKKFLDILNIEDNNLINSKTIYELYGAENSQIIEHSVNQIISSMKPVSYTIGIKKAEGIQFYEVLSKPIINGKELCGFLSIAYDEASKKEADLKKELFVATLVHDLKTPLQAQITSLELLLKEKFGKITPSQQEIITEVVESSKFMQKMLYSVLNVYKYNNGVEELIKTDFDLNNLVKTCIKEIENLAVINDIEIVYILNAKNTKINADEEKIRRSLANLLNNAINYAFKQTKVIIEFSEDKDNKIIKCKNIGYPIKEEIKEHIFDKYVTGKLNRKIGTGLGLYYCKKVIENHGGNIYLNTDGNQSEFTVKIPIN